MEENEVVKADDFMPAVGSLDDVMKEVSAHLADDDMVEFKAKVKDDLVKVKEAKKLVRILEAKIARMYKEFKDGIL